MISLGEEVQFGLIAGQRPESIALRFDLSVDGMVRHLRRAGYKQAAADMVAACESARRRGGL